MPLMKYFEQAKRERINISDLFDSNNNANLESAFDLINDELQPIIKKYTIESPQNLVDSYHF
jgi:hypothetical protein